MGEHELEIDMYTLLYLKWITYMTYCMVHRTLHKVMWQPGCEGSLGENVYILYVWLSSFAAQQNYHNIVNQLYSNIQ